MAAQSGPHHYNPPVDSGPVDLNAVHALVGVREALAELVALGPMGHKIQPVKDAESRSIIERANAAEPHMTQRSLICWQCAADNDRHNWSPTMTFGEHAHAIYDAWAKAKALLEGTD